MLPITTMQTSCASPTPQFRDVQQAVVSLLPQVLAPTSENNPEDRSDFRCLPLVKPRRDRAAMVSDKIGESIAYMSQNLNRPLQVSILAALVNISPSHYFALFKRQTGCAPISYFTRLRMEEARRLLETSDASVKEVAAQMGYDDPFYFSRVFKSATRLAPSNYRLQLRGDPGLEAGGESSM